MHSRLISSNRVGTWMAAIAVAVTAAFGLSACGTEASNESVPVEPSPRAEASVEPVAFAPVLEFKQQRLAFEDARYPVFADVQLPEVSGVDPEHAEAFAGLMEDDLLAALEEHSVARAESLGDDPGPYCEDSQYGGCGNEAWFEIGIAEIYEDFGTVSYTLGTHISQIAPQTRAMSTTMNLRTGEVPSYQDFIEGDSADLTLLIAATGQCTEDFAERMDPDNRVDAFSPTAAGFYFSWAAGKFASTACGIGQVTIPWEQISRHRQSQEVAAPTAEATPTQGQQAAHCAGDPALPDGIDERVCGSDVGGAQALQPGQYGGALVLSPSGNIVCSLHPAGTAGGAFVDCLMMEPFVSFGVDTKGAAVDLSDRSDGPIDSTPVTLGYGQAATFEDFACVSQEIGMSCWNTETSHGMFLSRAETVAW